MKVSGPYWWQVSIVSGNDLVPPGSTILFSLYASCIVSNFDFQRTTWLLKVQTHNLKENIQASVMTSSNGNISASLALYAWNSPVTGELPSQRPLTRSFDVFFDLRLNKRPGKQSGGWWFETPLRPLWRHCNVASTLFRVVNPPSRTLPTHRVIQQGSHGITPSWGARFTDVI